MKVSAAAWRRSIYIAARAAELGVRGFYAAARANANGA
jgi:hypothetical protein